MKKKLKNKYHSDYSKFSRKVYFYRKKTEKRGGRKHLSSRRNLKNHIHSTIEILVIAPSRICLYKPKDHLKNIVFIKELKKTIRLANINKSIVRICFRNTGVISATAGVYLLANMESIVTQHPNVIFRVTTPPRTPNNHTMRSDYVVHSALNRIGFYKVLKLGPFKTKKLPHVNNWQICSGDEVDSDLVGETILKMQSLGIQSTLYRSGIEAVSNVIEHAYSEKVPLNKEFPSKKWWMFIGVIDHELVCIVCDLGYGIPTTLPYTQTDKLLSQIKTKLKESFKQVTSSKKILVGDVLQINIATLIKETATKLGFRGKGGPDIKSFVDSHDGARLGIFSNRGRYMYSRKKTKAAKGISWGYNNKESIGGTIIEWSVPISDEALEVYNEIYSQGS